MEPATLAAPSTYAPARVRTEVACTKCHKITSVPFVPTPGRPVFCRDCFAKSAGSRNSFNGPNRSFSDEARPRPPPVPGARKRMMAQGRKGHFMYDAKAALADRPGGMDETNVRAFLEGLFARGARGSTEDAQLFLEEKWQAELITKEQRHALGNLVERYSFYR